MFGTLAHKSSYPLNGRYGYMSQPRFHLRKSKYVVFLEYMMILPRSSITELCVNAALLNKTVFCLCVNVGYNSSLQKVLIKVTTKRKDRYFFSTLWHPVAYIWVQQIIEKNGV